LKDYSKPFDPLHAAGSSKSAKRRQRFQARQRRDPDEAAAFAQREFDRLNDITAQLQQEAQEVPTATEAVVTVKTIAQSRVDESRAAREQAPIKLSILERLTHRTPLNSSSERITILRDGSAERKQEEIFRGWYESSTASSEEGQRDAPAPTTRHPIAGHPAPRAGEKFIAKRTGGLPQVSRSEDPAQAQRRQVARKHRQPGSSGVQTEAERNLRVQRGGAGRPSIISRTQSGSSSAQEEEEEESR
jgi:hypothetical protein